MKKKPTRRPGSDRRYDLDMIRDFLDHLLWEVRIAYHETQHAGINPELSEQLEKYIKKRQTAGLLFSTAVEMDERQTEPEKYEKLKRLQGELRKAQLVCLEALLHSLIPEAMDAAKNGRNFSVLSFKAIDDAISFYENRSSYMEGFADADGPTEDE